MTKSAVYFPESDFALLSALMAESDNIIPILFFPFSAAFLINFFLRRFGLFPFSLGF